MECLTKLEVWCDAGWPGDALGSVSKYFDISLEAVEGERHAIHKAVASYAATNGGLGASPTFLWVGVLLPALALLREQTLSRVLAVGSVGMVRQLARL